MTQLQMYPAIVNSPMTQLSGAIDNVQNTIPLVDASVLPAGPNICTIGSDETAETILYTAKSVNTLTGVTRGFQSVAKAWASGAKVARYLTAYDVDTMRLNLLDHETRINLKADLASPAFTGSPTATTQVANDNSIKLATTAYADRKADKAPTTATWIAPTLLNSWVSRTTAGEPTPGYYKDDLNIVRIRGTLQSGITTSDTVLFNLPAGYRPIGLLSFSQASYNGSAWIVTTFNVFPDGRVTIGTGGNIITPINGIIFRAEQ